ncbi:AAA+ ATPase domain-containing protein [Artemisia annua]|uniref:AAA+ ATPase domain-containing protein n=1 Tax=Artemisia annua TaxID=35608 RepID=A0A2U1QP74_ARTAN|nr:AAA+ ATPase domain-containing protein [Artemisia annua]
MKELWTTMASLMGVLAFSQTLLNTLLPPNLRFIFIKLFHTFLNYFSPYSYFDITEIEGVNTNELYNAVQLYLSSTSTTSSNRLSLTRGLNSTSITYTISHNHRLTDVFKGVYVVWEHIVTPRQTQTFSWRALPEEKRGFSLRVHKRDKDFILGSYFDYISSKASEIRRKKEDRLLYTNSKNGSLDSRGQPWESVPFKHPSTFETLAMDPTKKAEIMSDLRDFAEGSAFYKRAGRVWKRGYLLYGPPGTGKSSMIAAMANYLEYDIYDLELTEVQTNLELRKLLMKTSSKSIIVIEDIDCSINLKNRTEIDFTNILNGNDNNDNDNDNNNSITLSGLLNFTDGLWSSCGSERIFVFTTNHIEKLDPALLRSGRMDMHVFMSYCCFESLLILIKNYLGCTVNDMDTEILRQLEKVVCVAEMTPADVSEVLIKNRRDKAKAIRELVEILSFRARENEKLRRERNYLGCTVNDMDTEILRQLEKVVCVAEMTPADVSEVLIKNRRDKAKAIRELVEILSFRARENEKLRRERVAVA